MAKDRFNRFKPINWHSGFKQTGSFIKSYKSEVNKFAVSSVKPKKQHRSDELQNKLLNLYNIYKPVLTEWENEFLKSIISLPFQLTDKQKDVIKRIIKKHPELINEFLTSPV